jgi:hypothetical protein
LRPKSTTKAEIAMGIEIDRLAWVDALSYESQSLQEFSGALTEKSQSLLQQSRALKAASAQLTTPVSAAQDEALTPHPA